MCSTWPVGERVPGDVRLKMGALPKDGLLMGSVE
jgi:hypothetical protein